ncbi:BRO-N domain-containing protein [Pseudomonas citronellolis]|uniref:BRO-N domain-containing protein n=1 Tax=Pseudomonas citronellolis TaxID=53408 RepID=UPI00209F058D|nr:BRO family protein [Pseudomonas citronellolis]MCP1604307.1 prophage antirepressor-like protein [Pseudomonas citronellolis]MCP1655130.1 prophage antirepressor-like protein [Pseudomonas citronellolis]MCP1723323.1 prophage antirepressor-like protein [Pseudomonas citronellolis]
MDDVYPPLVFQRYNRSLRGVPIDGQPWLVARDLGSLIGERVEPYVINRLDCDLKRQARLATRNGEESVWLINDFGLFYMLSRYRDPEHRSLRRWLMVEVLPVLRDHAECSPIQPRRVQLQGLRPAVGMLEWQGELWMRFNDIPSLFNAPNSAARWRGFLPNWRRSS